MHIISNEELVTSQTTKARRSPLPEETRVCKNDKCKMSVLAIGAQKGKLGSQLFSPCLGPVLEQSSEDSSAIESIYAFIYSRSLFAKVDFKGPTDTLMETPVYPRSSSRDILSA